MHEQIEIPSLSDLIVFTDLDGTLLDHETYSFEPATEALAALRENNIPLILASSKTAAEVYPLRKQLGFEHCPAIVENGAGLLSQNSSGVAEAETYASLLKRISELPTGLCEKFRGFSQFDKCEISEVTGLSVEAAHLAKQRSYSEPGIWTGSDSDLEEFLIRLEEVGVVAQRGGRFLTLSFGGDKVSQMQGVLDAYRTSRSHLMSIALGDAPNDVAMLKAADIGVVIPNRAHAGIAELIGEDCENIIYASDHGPLGWNNVVLDVISRFEQGVGVG